LTAQEDTALEREDDMTIGLTSDELMNEFLKSFDRRQEALKRKVEGMAHGEEPTFQKSVSGIVEDIRKQAPIIPDPQFWAGFSQVLGNALYALMDAVAANNAAIEKAIQVQRQS
jgi:hypothetical protein